jgi:hypothetical protein
MPNQSQGGKSMECQASDNLSPEAHQKRTLSRRQLLKALVASGSAVTAASFLPCQWQKPVVNVGVLPAHAQISPTPTPTETPTPTPVPFIIVTCSARNITGAGTIRATDTIETYADIEPARAGIEMKQTITLHQAGHPDDGVVRVHTDLTYDNGRFTSPDFDISVLNNHALISPGAGRLTVLWEFIDSRGTGTCSRDIEIAP